MLDKNQLQDLLSKENSLKKRLQAAIDRKERELEGLKHLKKTLESNQGIEVALQLLVNNISLLN